MVEIWKLFIELCLTVPRTLLMALLILIFSSILGILLALIRSSGLKVLDLIVRLYVSLFRGTPLLVQLFLCYFGLPTFLNWLFNSFHIEFHVIQLDVFTVLLVSFSLYYAAYQQETVRASFKSVDSAQKELADSLGYSFWMKMLRVILPQTLIYAVPNVFNTFLSTIKAISLGFTISFIDIFAKAKLLASISSQYVLTFSLAAVVYFFVCEVFSRIRLLAEAKLEIWK